MFDAQEASEDLAEGPDVMKVVEDDDARKICCVVLALFGNVRQILSKFLARLMVDVEGGHQTSQQVFTRPSRTSKETTTI